MSTRATHGAPFMPLLGDPPVRPPLALFGMSSVRSPFDAPQLDFDLQLARLPKKKARKVAEGQEQYFIETVTGNKRVCRNFPFCSCESCRTALACSGYVCLIAESARRSLRLPPGRTLRLACHSCILWREWGFFLRKGLRLTT